MEGLAGGLPRRDRSAPARGLAHRRELARSLFRRVRARREGRTVARAFTNTDTGISLAAVVTERHKLVMDRRAHTVALYELAVDPGEQRDIAPNERAVVARLAKILRRPEDSWLAFRDRELDVTTAKKLRALGYAQ